MNILITGAARGIGRGLCRILLDKGHRVFLIDNDAPELEHTTANVLTRHRGSYASALADLRRPADIAAAVEQASSFFGGHLDVFISNAAVTAAVGARPFADLHLDEWNRQLEVNLTAPMLISQLCLPLLRGGVAGGRGARGGTIIFMSSTRAKQSEPNSEGYAATKAGLLGLTHSLAATLAPLSITVNAILPGWINVANECKDADEKGTTWEDGLSEDDHRWHFSGRVGKVEDVYGAVEYLMTQSFVNGQEIVVDGGVSRKMVYPEE